MSVGGDKNEIPTLTDPDEDDDEGISGQTRHADDLRLRPKRAQTAWLLVTGGKRSLGTLFEVRPRMTLGRSDEADVVLDEDGVSRRHAQVELVTGGVVRVTDLGSSNGVRIDGRKVKTHSLRDGERLRLGEAVLTLVHFEDDEPMLAKNLAASLARLGTK